MVYSNINKTLYATNALPRCSSSVYKLNLDSRQIVEWENIGILSNKPYQDYYESMCMIDNDRFISILSHRCIDRDAQ